MGHSTFVCSYCNEPYTEYDCSGICVCEQVYGPDCYDDIKNKYGDDKPEDEDYDFKMCFMCDPNRPPTELELVKIKAKQIKEDYILDETLNDFINCLFKLE